MFNSPRRIDPDHFSKRYKLQATKLEYEKSMLTSAFNKQIEKMKNIKSPSKTENTSNEFTFSLHSGKLYSPHSQIKIFKTQENTEILSSDTFPEEESFGGGIENEQETQESSQENETNQKQQKNVTFEKNLLLSKDSLEFTGSRNILMQSNDSLFVETANDQDSIPDDVLQNISDDEELNIEFSDDSDINASTQEESTNNDVNDSFQLKPKYMIIQRCFDSSDEIVLPDC